MFSWKDLKDKTLSEESKGSSSVHSVSAKKGVPLPVPPTPAPSLALFFSGNDPPPQRLTGGGL